MGPLITLCQSLGLSYPNSTPAQFVSNRNYIHRWIEQNRKHTTEVVKTSKPNNHQIGQIFCMPIINDQCFLSPLSSWLTSIYCWNCFDCTRLLLHLQIRTVFYGQYKCTGPGSSFAGRVSWSKELTDEEAQPFISLIFIDGAEWIRM